jgi:hypothetical protein
MVVSFVFTEDRKKAGKKGRIYLFAAAFTKPEQEKNIDV